MAGPDMAVDVCDADEHGGHAEDADQRAGRDEAGLWRLPGAAKQDDDGQDEGDRAERGANRVGELRPFGDLDAFDPQVAGGAG